MIIIFFIILHLFFLYETGSENPKSDRNDRNFHKIPFNIFFYTKRSVWIYFIFHLIYNNLEYPSIFNNSPIILPKQTP